MLRRAPDSAAQFLAIADFYPADGSLPTAKINRILATAEVRKLLQSQDVQIAGGTAETCAEYIRSQVALWSKVVREARIKAE